MTINEIMVIFKNPETIHSLSTGNKLLGVGFTMVLGMGITFMSLIILKCVIDIMAKVLVEKEKKPEIKISEKKEVEEVEEIIPDNDEDVIAAIVIALATKLAANTNKKIIIRNIKRVNNQHSPWGQLGIVEQINNRL